MKVKNEQSGIGRKWTMITGFGLLLISMSTFVACKKYSFDESGESTFLEVEEANSSVLFYYSSTSEPNCGSVGYDQFESYLSVYDSTDALATLTFGDVGGFNNDTIFVAHSEAFPILDVPAFQPNLISNGVAGTISSHRTQTVVANSACDLTVGSSILTLNTTTQFFQDLEEGSEYYLTPYIVVDSILAPQAGHPDTPSTYHRKVVTDVARLPNYPVRYLGYKITSGAINKGYRVNLKFEAYRDPSWIDPDKISVILVLTKRTNGVIEFVNANTNY